MLGVLLREGPRQLTELAAVERINPTLLSRVVGRLEDDGLVKRSAQEQDRRSYQVSITDAGRALAEGLRHERCIALAGRLAAARPVARRNALRRTSGPRSAGRSAGRRPEGLMSTPTADEPQELTPSSRQPSPAGRSHPPAATRRTATFAALANPNFRRFFYGQAVSMIGTWMQSVAQSWLVLELTGSGTALGLVIALQTLPVLFVAPYAGLIADRVDKRRMLVGTQTAMGVLALVARGADRHGQRKLWMVYVLAVALGAANAVDNPTRQAFVLEMVGPDHLRNAVTLNSVLVNAARAIGPAIAGT